MTRSISHLVPSRLAAAGALAGAIAVSGCAGPAPAPVESRGPGPGATAATPAAPETPDARVTVVPLGSEAAPQPVTPAAPASASARPSPSPRAANPAVVALLNHANAQSRAGQHGGAASSLERAIKIEPGNAWLWHRLAATRLDEGRPGEAASLAAKSNSLAAGDPELQADNWRLIAAVHRSRGEPVAARAAEERARRLAVPRS